LASTDQRKKKSLLTDSLQTLMGSLGKKRGDKMKRALADLTSLDTSDTRHAVVAGKHATDSYRCRVTTVRRHASSCDFVFTIATATVMQL